MYKVYRKMWNLLPVQMERGGIGGRGNIKRTKKGHINICPVYLVSKLQAFLYSSNCSCLSLQKVLEMFTYSSNASLQQSCPKVPQFFKYFSYLSELLAASSYTLPRYLNTENGCRVNNYFQVPLQNKSSETEQVKLQAMYNGLL